MLQDIKIEHVNIPIELLIVNNNQPRKVFNEKDLDELIESILEHGILHPILARKSAKEEGKYEIIAGERRYRAAQLLFDRYERKILKDREELARTDKEGAENPEFKERMDAIRFGGLNALQVKQVKAKEDEIRAGQVVNPMATVPVAIVDCSDEDAFILSIVENLQRKDLSDIEEATAIQKLFETRSYSEQALASKLGKSVSYIRNKIRLVEQATAKIIESLETGKIKEGHARALLNLSPDASDKIVDQIIEEDLSVREAEERVRQEKQKHSLMPANKTEDKKQSSEEKTGETAETEIKKTVEEISYLTGEKEVHLPLQKLEIIVEEKVVAEWKDQYTLIFKNHDKYDQEKITEIIQSYFKTDRKQSFTNRVQNHFKKPKRF